MRGAAHRVSGETAQAGSPDLLRQRVAAARRALSPAARRVIAFIDRNRVETLASSAMELATKTGTSDATVIRAVQALGFDGLGALRQALVASLQHDPTPADRMRLTLEEVGGSVDHAFEAVLRTHREALDALQSPAVRDRVAAAVTALHPAQRIAVFGVGPSAALARYMAILLGRSGRHAYALDATGIALADQMLHMRLGDALLAIAYTHPYREVAAVFSEARRLGLPVVLITDQPDSKLARLAQVVVPVRRGRTERIALHGATLVVLEALALALSACNRDGAIAALERLNELREAVGGRRADVG